MLFWATTFEHINEDGTITPATNESSRIDEPGHAALAIGEFFRATGEVELAGFDLFDLSARCITHQAFSEEASDNGMAYAALGLLSLERLRKEILSGNAFLTLRENN